MKKFLPLIIFILAVVYFFRPFFLYRLLPIPADTIVGLYHPFRDLYAKDYPNGVPFKNALITDPVRQQYPWRNLTIVSEKKIQLPTWNPYSFSGSPLLANHQSAPFYPFNILFFILPFSLAWGLLIFLGPLLSGIFLFFYLRNIHLDSRACFLGAIAYAFCGFSIAWMEWGTITHVALWLPLALLSIDKVFSYLRSQKTSNKIIKIQKLQIWLILFTFSLISSFFAGHLQTFFYIFVTLIGYIIVRFIQYKSHKRIILLFSICFILFFFITAIQWIPTFQYILLSARTIDQANWNKPGWFIPWQQSVQFLAPDFFGNPATLNYWGIWNYGEFIGYIGILPLIMAFFALFFRKDKKTLFYGTLFFVSLIFVFPSFFARFPFLLHIPFLSTTQPTRLLAIIDFSLVVLAALGFDYFLKKKTGMIYILGFFACLFCGLWIFIYLHALSLVSPENVFIAKHNLIFSTILFFIIALLLFIIRFNRKLLSSRIASILILLLLGITILDVLRFAEKFSPFTQESYLFPQTETLSFLQSHLGNYRSMSLDDRILPPNFSVMYHIQSVDGYDPLYIQSYGEFVAASEQKKLDISHSFGFNRIITPHNYKSPFINLLGVKYVLSLQDIQDQQLKKVFQEGQTRIYENIQTFPRVFFVSRLYAIESPKATMQKMFHTTFNSESEAVIKTNETLQKNTLSLGSAKIIQYTDNSVNIDTQNDARGFLVFTDIFYPSWHATIDNKETQIYKTDYTFRGIFVPSGRHHIMFYNSLL